MTKRTCLAIASAVLLFPTAAVSQDTAAEALRTLVSDLDATPEWSASFTSLSYNAAADTATIEGLMVRSEEPGTDVTFETITVIGYQEAPDGTVSVDTLRADGGAVTAGFSTVALTDIVIEDLSVPVLDPVVFAPDQPVASMMKLYREALKIGFSTAFAADIDVIQTFEEVESRVAYEQTRLEGYSDGILKLMQVGAARMEAPIEQQLMTISIGAIEGRDTDLGAFVHVSDPDAYTDGRGDMVWRNVLGYVVYSDIVVDAPGARVFIDLVEAKDLNIRQPPESFSEFFDVLMLDADVPDWRMERLATQAMPNVLGAWSIGALNIGGVRVDAPGVDRLAIGDFALRDFSIDGLREFSFEGFEMALRGQFATRVGRFSIGNIIFGGIEGVKRLIATINRGGEPDPDQLVPIVGFAEVVDFQLQTPDIENLSLARFRSDTADFVGMVPTTTSLDLVNLVIPVSAIQEPRARSLLRRFGYEEINFGMSIRAGWANNTVYVRDFVIDFKEMGNLVFNFSLSDVPLSAFEGGQLDFAALPDVSLDEVDVTFTDDSIVGHGLELLAETMGAPKDKIREQFAGALPFFLSMGTAGTPELGRLIRESGFLDELTPAVSEFIAVPESSITIEARPSGSVPIAQITDALQTAPGTLIDLLGLSVSSRAPELPPIETVVEEPMTEDVADDPTADDAVEEPIAEDGADEAMADDAVEDPVAEDGADEAVEDDAVEEPTAEDGADEAVADDAVEDPMPEDGANEAVADDAVEEAIADELLADEVVEEPMAENGADEPMVDDAVGELIAEDDAVEETMVDDEEANPEPTQPAAE